jgi:hypothetical protein
MLRYLLTVALFAHGLGHLLFLANSWGLWKGAEEGRSWLFSGMLGAGQTLEGIFGLLWLIPLVGFVAVSWGYLTHQGWWPQLALGSAVFSSALIVLWGAVSLSGAPSSPWYSTWPSSPWRSGNCGPERLCHEGYWAVSDRPTAGTGPADRNSGRKAQPPAWGAATVTMGPSVLLVLYAIVGTLSTIVGALACRGSRRRRLLLRTPLVGGALLPWVYLLLVRPWHLNWSVTEEEARRSLPYDHLVPRPIAQITRAIAIHASTDEVWWWLVQLGRDRGGFYSYDWLEEPGGPGHPHHQCQRDHPRVAEPQGRRPGAAGSREDGRRSRFAHRRHGTGAYPRSSPARRPRHGAPARPR